MLGNGPRVLGNGPPLFTQLTNRVILIMGRLGHWFILVPIGLGNGLHVLGNELHELGVTL